MSRIDFVARRCLSALLLANSWCGAFALRRAAPSIAARSLSPNALPKWGEILVKRRRATRHNSPTARRRDRNDRRPRRRSFPGRASNNPRRASSRRLRLRRGATAWRRARFATRAGASAKPIPRRVRDRETPKASRKRLPEQRHGHGVPTIELEKKAAFVAELSAAQRCGHRGQVTNLLGNRQARPMCLQLHDRIQRACFRDDDILRDGSQHLRHQSRAAARLVKDEAGRRERPVERRVLDEMIQTRAIAAQKIERALRRFLRRHFEERFAETRFAKISPIDGESAVRRRRDMGGKPTPTRPSREGRGRIAPALEAERIGAQRRLQLFERQRDALRRRGSDGKFDEAFGLLDRAELHLQRFVGERAASKAIEGGDVWRRENHGRRRRCGGKKHDGGRG